MAPFIGGFLTSYLSKGYENYDHVDEKDGVVVGQFRIDCIMSNSKGTKSFYGSVKVGERGQIFIPKKARDEYHIHAGDSLIVFGDKNMVIKIMKAEMMRDIALKVLEELDNNNVEFVFKSILKIE